jgi:hypothetical protein
LVEHGVNGYLFKPFNATSIAGIVQLFLGKRQRWAEIGLAGLEKVTTAPPEQHHSDVMSNGMKAFIGCDRLLTRALQPESAFTHARSADVHPVIIAVDCCRSTPGIERLSMSVYQSAEQFYAVMQEVFDYVVQHPDRVDCVLAQQPGHSYEHARTRRQRFCLMAANRH